MKNTNSRTTKSSAKGITNKLQSLYELYGRIKTASYDAGYKLDEAKKLLKEEQKPIEPGLKIKGVKKKRAITKIKSKLADIKQKSVAKKKVKAAKKSDKKKISQEKKKSKALKKTKPKKKTK